MYLANQRIPHSLLAGFIFVIAISGCTQDPFEPKTISVLEESDAVDVDSTDLPDPPPPPPPVDDDCSENKIYFERDLETLLLASCGTQGGCHSPDSAYGGLDLSNYDSVLSSGAVVASDAMSSKLYQRISASDPSQRMPPPGSATLSAAGINKLYRWIEDGALNCEKCDTTLVTYSQDVSSILNGYGCTASGCHASGAGLELYDYTRVKLQVDNGKLEGAINHLDGYSAMPKNQPKMATCDIDKISKWINDGAKND